MIRINKLNLPVCPNCRAEVGYLEAFTAKNKSCYKCPNCQNISKVFLTSLMFKSLEITEIISLIVFAIVIFQGGGYCLLGLIFITLAFTVFYVLSPFMISLNPIAYDFEEAKAGDENTESKECIGEDTSNEIFSN